MVMPMVSEKVSDYWYRYIMISLEFWRCLIYCYQNGGLQCYISYLEEKLQNNWLTFYSICQEAIFLSCIHSLQAVNLVGLESGEVIKDCISRLQKSSLATSRYIDATRNLLAVLDSSKPFVLHNFWLMITLQISVDLPVIPLVHTILWYLIPWHSATT